MPYAYQCNNFFLPPNFFFDFLRHARLSDLQLEGILYACQRHLKFLPSGERAGFFIADGAGVGKGRQVAGILLDNFARGRSKHVWFSASPDLSEDAKRDLEDIGCHVNIISSLQELDYRSKGALGLSKRSQNGVRTGPPAPVAFILQFILYRSLLLCLICVCARFSSFFIV